MSIWLPVKQKYVRVRTSTFHKQPLLEFFISSKVLKKKFTLHTIRHYILLHYNSSFGFEKCFLERLK